MKVTRIACLLALSCAGSYVSSSAELTEPVGTSSPTQTATVTITTAGTLQTISVLTQGAIGLDFNAASGGTCSVGHTYAVGNTCAVNYTFKPTKPWIRYGGVALADSSGKLLGNTYVTATGTGPQPIFPSNNSVATLVTDIDGPEGVAVDGNGNVYVADGSSQIKEIVAVNGKIPAKPTIRMLGGGFLNPLGVAVDGSGNVFVADNGNAAVKEILAVNGSIPANPTINIVGRIYYPWSVAVDGRGNVYVGNANWGAVQEIVAADGSIPVNPTIRILVIAYDDFSSPLGLGVDASGNVYFSDATTNGVEEIVAVNGSIPTNPATKALGSGFYHPIGLAVDGSGNVYVADGDINYYEIGKHPIKEIVAVNGSIPANPTINVIGNGFYQPFGLAVDGSGNVYVGDSGNLRVAELNRADPPNLSFAATPVGLTGSPQSVIFGNSGNVTLTGSTLSVSANWDQVAGSGTPADCTASFSLVAGAACNLSIIFDPTETGPLTGAATFTDNALNMPGAAQQVSLSGAGLGGFSEATLAFGNLALGQQKDVSLQFTDTGTGPVTFAPVINGPSFTVPSSENGCGTAIPAGHSCSFSVRFLPRTYGGHADILTLAGPGVTATVQLTGQTTGVGAEIGLLDFGTIPYGTPAILDVPMVNYGVAKNVTFSTSINGSSFQVLTAGNSCLYGLTEALQCTIPVEFSPSAVGDYANVLTITASSGDVSTVGLIGIASQP
jgi:sugar lactone lactonase YvrE